MFAKREYSKTDMIKEKEPKKFIIAERISQLFNKLSAIEKTTKDPNIWSFDVFLPPTNYSSSEMLFYKGYSINTIYGKRRIVIKDARELYYGNENLIKFEDNFRPRITPPFYIINPFFCINCDSDDIEIKPYPQTKFSPEEIDLAILEFENAIEPIYKEAVKRQNIHRKCLDYFRRLTC